MTSWPSPSRRWSWWPGPLFLRCEQRHSLRLATTPLASGGPESRSQLPLKGLQEHLSHAMRADYSRDRSVSLGSSRRWQRWQLRAAQCCRWFCGSPLWPSGPGTAELRRRYVEIGANYEGIITLQPHDRGEMRSERLLTSI